MTIYASDLDYATIEREAFIRGDAILAQCAADAEDRAAEVSELEDKVLELEKNIKEIEQEKDEIKAGITEILEDKLDALYDLIRDGKRVSGREEMLALVKSITEALQ